jgi:uncharacterized protein
VLEAYADRWALITGASSGIGAEFARQLAARGMHLVLTARRRDLLERLAEDLHIRHGTKSEIIDGDLSDPGEPARIVETIATRGIIIDLLVNNAGFAVIGDSVTADRERVLELVRLNVDSLTDLTYRVLPGMVERRQGAIVNVSSLSAFQPVPYMAAYSASKAYVLHFSEALWAEVFPSNVTVMALCPGATRTDFFDAAGIPGWLKKHSSQSPEQVVRSALRALEKRKQYIVTGWKNYFLSLLVRIARRKTVVRQSMRYFRPVSQKRKKPDKKTEPTPAEKP